MSTGSPLAGRRIVVTRAADQAGVLADMISQRGGEAVVVPLVAVVPIASGLSELRRCSPDEVEWLVVTSPNAADAYLSVHARVPAHVAAVGESTAAVLRERGVEVDLDRKSTRLNSSHIPLSRMPSSA